MTIPRTCANQKEMPEIPNDVILTRVGRLQRNSKRYAYHILKRGGDSCTSMAELQATRSKFYKKFAKDNPIPCKEIMDGYRKIKTWKNFCRD